MALRIILFTTSIFLIGCVSNTPRKVTVIDKSENRAIVESVVIQKDSKQIKKDKEKPVFIAPVTVEKKFESWVRPIEAKVTKKYSKNSKGMTFSSVPDQRVMAIRDGEVTYIGNQMKSLGEIIIIKHSLGFYSTYTQLSNIKISLGDKIKKGQIIGLSSNKSFYFEMKKYDQHIDPSIYINF